MWEWGIEMDRKKLLSARLIIVFLCITGISILYCGILYYRNDKVDIIKESGWDQGKDKMQCCIDGFGDEEDTISLSGWCIVSGEDIGYANYYVVFHNIAEDSYYRVNTVYKQRADVTAYFNDGYNYDNSGFYTRVRKCNLPEGEYEVCIWYLCNDYNLLYTTDQHFGVG